MAIPDFKAYSELVYSVPSRYANIQHSTLVLASVGVTLAKLEGLVVFASDIVLDVWELLDFDSRRILNYSYEIHRVGERIIWYDPFEHPHNPELASTHPHHKHVLPNLKHNRVPAPEIRFDQPNLLHLIEGIERDYFAAEAGF